MDGKWMALLLALGLLVAAAGTAAAGSKPGGTGNEVVGEFPHESVSPAHPGPFDQNLLARISGE